MIFEKRENEGMAGDVRPPMMDGLRLAEEWGALVKGEVDEVARMATFTALVYQSDARVSFAGFYRLEDDGSLVIGPYQGPIGCLRIAPGRGVCGRVAEHGDAVIVPDVNQYPGHIACDPRARSEMVLPVRKRDGRLVAVFDVDSASAAAFSEADVKVLGPLLDPFG